MSEHAQYKSSGTSSHNNRIGFMIYILSSQSRKSMCEINGIINGCFNLGELVPELLRCAMKLLPYQAEPGPPESRNPNCETIKLVQPHFHWVVQFSFVWHSTVICLSSVKRVPNSHTVGPHLFWSPFRCGSKGSQEGFYIAVCWLQTGKKLFLGAVTELLILSLQ